MNREPGTARAGGFDGGILVLLGGLLAAGVLNPAGGPGETVRLAWLLGAAVWVGAWGVITDRWVLPRGLRALAVLAAAAALHHGGLRIDALKLPFSTTFIELGGWSLPLAALWMWLCATLFARAGTIPAVAYGVGTVAWATLAVVCLLQPHTTSQATLWVSFGLGAGSLLVFLARLRTAQPCGTGGAHLLGFLLGAVSILGLLKNTAFLAAVLPLLLICVPLFGATYAYLPGLRRGSREMALAQRREHLHWRLLREGYSARQVAVLLTAGAAWFGLLAILLVRLIEANFAVKALILLAFVGVGGLVGFVLLRLLPRDEAPAGGAIRLLGVRLTPVSMEEALSRARRFIAEGSPHIIVTSDAIGVVRAQEDPELRDIMEAADLVTPDGQGVILAARLLKAPIRERVSGVDMVQHLCSLAREAGRPVFLLGGAEGIAEAAAERLREAVPGLEVAGTQHGYFGPEDEPALIARIRDARPAVLFVAFGIPRQEKWIRAHMDELGVPVCIGIGGSLDVISGRLQRAPVWMRRCGLEWLFRVCQEPWRLPRLKALPQMAWLALKAALKGETGDQLE